MNFVHSLPGFESESFNNAPEEKNWQADESLIPQIREDLRGSGTVERWSPRKRDIEIFDYHALIPQ